MVYHLIPVLNLLFLSTLNRKTYFNYFSLIINNQHNEKNIYPINIIFIDIKFL